MRVRSALQRRREAATGEDAKGKLAVDLISSYRSKAFGSKKDILRYIRNWILDNYPLVLEFLPLSRAALNSISMNPKRKRKDNDEAIDRWANTWIDSCVSEPTEESMFDSSVREISFLAQLGVNFNFSSVSNLEDDLRRTEQPSL